MPVLQLDDIQGIVLYGYGRLRQRVLPAARHQRRRGSQGVAEDARRSQRAVRTRDEANAASTSPSRGGPGAARAARRLVERFAAEFREGMAGHRTSAADPRRRRREQPGTAGTGVDRAIPSRTSC